MWKNKYRIVTDAYSGYEAQIKYRWFPFVWVEMTTPGKCEVINGKFIYVQECSCNTHCSIESAEALIISYKKAQTKTPKHNKKQKVVKMII